MNLLIIGEIAVLTLLQQGGDFPVHAVETVDVGLNLLTDTGVPGFLRGVLQRLKLGTGGFRQGFP